MKIQISAIFVMFFLTFTNTSFAATNPSYLKSLDSIHSGQFCAKDNKKKKGDSEEEPECD